MPFPLYAFYQFIVYLNDVKMDDLSDGDVSQFFSDAVSQSAISGSRSALTGRGLTDCDYRLTDIGIEVAREVTKHYEMVKV